MGAGGVLLCDKPVGRSSFHLVHVVRKKSGIQKVGHAGTLDPFASGLMIILVGKTWTRQQAAFMHGEKEYLATVCLGSATDTYDVEGKETCRSAYIPTESEVENVIAEFQGELLQTPPMYSAKKIGGKRLYELARQGIEVARPPVPVRVATTLVSYSYPLLSLSITCSKGTYIRSIGHEIGERLGSHGHVQTLRRVKSGQFFIESAIPYEELMALSQSDLFEKFI